MRGGTRHFGEEALALGVAQRRCVALPGLQVGAVFELSLARLALRLRHLRSLLRRGGSGGHRLGAVRRRRGRRVADRLVGHLSSLGLGKHDPRGACGGK